MHSLFIRLAVFLFIIQFFQCQTLFAQNTCETATTIVAGVVIDVDNSTGDRWYQFTAPKSGEVAITTAYPSYEMGNTMHNGQDTFIKVYEACNGEIIASNDDYPGFFGGSHLEMTMEENTRYYILMDDRFTSGQYRFELLYLQDARVYSEEESAEVVNTGVHRAMVNYANYHWFSYTFSESGMLRARTESTLRLVLPYADETELPDWDDDFLYKQEFDYYGIAGETILIRAKDGLDSYRSGNSDVELSLFLQGSNGCETAVDISEGQYTLNHNLDPENWQADVWYAFEAPANGNLTISSCGLTDTDTKLAIFSECGAKITDNDDTCEAAAEVYLEGLEAEEVILIRWDDTQNADWDPGEWEYAFNVSFDEITPCDEFTDLSESVEVDDSFYYDVDTNEGSDMFGFTVPEDGTFFMTTTLTPSPTNNCNLIVRNAECEVIAELDNTPGAFGGTEYGRDVLEGEQYFFEWTDKFEAQNYQVNFFFQDIKGGVSCDEPAIAIEGANTVDDWFHNQYYAYTAETDGVLEISTCETAGYNSKSSLYLAADCNGTPVAEEIWWGGCGDEERFSYQYEAIAGQSLIIKLYERGGGDYYDYDFNLTFTSTCEVDEIETEETACGSYLFDEEELTASGIYNATFTNEAGCDSLVTLDLTILELTEGMQEVEACTSYDWEGTTYSETGTYYETLVNASGCDSLATLNLTIHDTSEGAADVTSCTSYQWEGQNYTASGTYYETLVNASGCDSLATLNLTILADDEENVEREACGSFEFDGDLLTESGEYQALLINEAGCDSLVNLSLIVYDEPDATVTLEANTLVVADQKDVAYQWFDCDTDEEMENENTNHLTPQKAGIYAVEVIGENCSARSECIIFEGEVLQITNHQSTIRAYPNPTTSSVQIELGSNYSNVEVEILSITGHRISYSSYELTSMVVINLGKKKGIYIARVSTQGRPLETLKLIKN